MNKCTSQYGISHFTVSLFVAFSMCCRCIRLVYLKQYTGIAVALKSYPWNAGLTWNGYSPSTALSVLHWSKIHTVRRNATTHKDINLSNIYIHQEEFLIKTNASLGNCIELLTLGKPWMPGTYNSWKPKIVSALPSDCFNVNVGFIINLDITANACLTIISQHKTRNI